MFIILAIILALTAISLVHALRVGGRFRARAQREADLGEMIWYRLDYQIESTKTASSEPADLARACHSLISRLERSDGNGQSHDGAVSAIWHRGDDNLVRLFLGITKNNSGYPNISNVGNFASNMGFRAREINEDEFPSFDPDAAATAEYHMSRVRGDSYGVEPVVGPVARTLGDSDNLHGTVLMTFEPMGTWERTNFSNRFNDDAKTDSAESGGNPFFQRSVTRFSQAPIRGSIAAVSHDGSQRNSSEIVSLVTTSLASTFFTAHPTRPLHGTSKMSMATGFLLSALGLILSGGYWMFSEQPAGVTIPMMILAVAGPLGAAFGVVNSDSLSGRTEFSKWLAKGEVVLPRFNIVSPLQLFRRIFLRSGMDDERRQNNLLRRFIPPGDPGVLPLNGDSMMELISINPKRPGKNLDVLTIPMVSVPANFEDRSNNDLFVGFDGNEAVISIPVKDIPFGMFSSGMMGSGKSNILEVLYISMTNECVKKHHSQLLTPIWGETKGEGAYDVWDMVKDVPRALFIDFHNPEAAFRLALEGRRIMDERASVAQVIANCETFVSAMQYAWGEGIKAESRASLIEVVRIAMLSTPDELELFDFPFEVDMEQPDIVAVSLYLLGGYNGDTTGYRDHHNLRAGDNVLKHQLTAVRDDISHVLEDHENSKGKVRDGFIDDDKELQRLSELRISISRLLTYHEGRGSDLLSPPRNKMAELARAPRFWQPRGKRSVYLHQLPKHDAPIIINTGPYRQPNGSFSSDIDEAVAQKLLRMTFYTLWKHVQASCQGWQRQRKYVPFFFDELSDVASSSFSEETPNVIDDVSNEGRSMGAGLFGATQTLGRLPEPVINDVSGFASQAYFRTRNRNDARKYIDNVAPGTVFDPVHLSNSPIGTCIASLKMGQNNTPAFTLQVPKSDYWAKCLFSSDSVEQAIYRYEQEYKYKGRADALDASRRSFDKGPEMDSEAL